jgi:hypothetical protein
MPEAVALVVAPQVQMAPVLKVEQAGRNLLGAQAATHRAAQPMALHCKAVSQVLLATKAVAVVVVAATGAAALAGTVTVLPATLEAGAALATSTPLTFHLAF